MSAYRRRRTLWAASAGVCVLGPMMVTACSSTTAVQPGATAPAGGGSAAAQGQATGPASTAPADTASGQAPAPAAPECTTAQLRISETSPVGATGHQGVQLRFTNIGGSRCFLDGYPGVAALDRDNRLVMNAERTLKGFMTGGLPAGQTRPLPVVLAPGQSAEAEIEAQDEAANGAANCPGAAATTLAVTAPDQRESVILPNRIRICAAFQVHPIAAASSGPAS